MRVSNRAAANSAAGPGQTVKVKSTVTISKEGWFGYVKSKNSNCLADRKVVIKQATTGPIYKCQAATSKTITL